MGYVAKMTKYEENAESVQQTNAILGDLDAQINELRDRQDDLLKSIEITMTNDAEEALKNGDDAEQDFYDAYGIFPKDYLNN